jgi:hypothetical protein
MPGRAIKFPTGPSNSRLYGGNVKSNALGLPGGGRADRGWIWLVHYLVTITGHSIILMSTHTPYGQEFLRGAFKKAISEGLWPSASFDLSIFSEGSGKNLPISEGVCASALWSFFLGGSHFTELVHRVCGFFWNGPIWLILEEVCVNLGQFGFFENINYKLLTYKLDS